jgi:hypothetical protein
MLLPGFLREIFGPRVFSEFLANPDITDEHKATILAYFLERTAYLEEHFRFLWTSAFGLPPKEGTPSTSLYFLKDFVSTFNQNSPLFKAVEQKLADKGIMLSWRDFQPQPFGTGFINTTPLKGFMSNWTAGDEQLIQDNASSYQGAQIGFTFVNQTDTSIEYKTTTNWFYEGLHVLSDLNSTEDQVFYKLYMNF